jgi:hypothetical protein
VDSQNPSNPVSAELRSAWLAAVKQGVLVPEYHGVWHFSPEALTRIWHEGDRTVRELARRGVRPAGLTAGHGSALLSEYFQADDFSRALVPLGAEEQEEMVRHGVSIFERLFGWPPRSTVPPHYLWGRSTERAWRAAGIRSVQAVNRSVMLRRPFGFLRTREFCLGRISPTGLLYLVRNCRFEPALYGDSAQSAFRQVMKAFRRGRPAVVSCHRINFSGRVFPARRDQTLCELDRFLKLVLAATPNVRFMASCELASVLTNDRARRAGRHAGDSGPARPEPVTEGGFNGHP